VIFFDGEFNTCLNICPDGYYKMYEINTCVSECPDDYKIIEETKVCLKCDDSCRECFGPGSNECESCYRNWFFFDNDNVCTDVSCGEFEFRSL